MVLVVLVAGCEWAATKNVTIGWGKRGWRSGSGLDPCAVMVCKGMERRSEKGGSGALRVERRRPLL